ncbi:MAG: HAD-IIIC family phosphatase [Verrucomicrobiales bacterium]|nr:HAD-IIIC family phosphatase [Verrucomicrobiales bacterium]
MNGLLISDFNIENLASYLRNDKQKPLIESVKVSYGQVTQALLDAGAEEWSPRPDFTLVWTRPESALMAFRRWIEFQESSLDQLLQQVDDFAALLLAAASRTSLLFVPLWSLPPCHPGHGLLDLSGQHGVARALMRANERLLERLDGQANIFPLLTSKWLELSGAGAHSARLWYLGKIPFSNEVFKAAARDLRSGIRGIQGKSRKVIICDLDDTLWGGIVGDDGWRQLVLGGHDPVGEALVDFQRELKSLTRRGVILGIVSKNEESVALDAIRQHPEMILRVEDFAGWRINWQDKAKNISDLMAELNLGLDSAVFLDDNPVERERVKEALPEVLVPDWPVDKKQYVQALLALDCFDRPGITQEDRARASMYTTDRQRDELRSTVGSLDDWLEKLEIVVRVSPLSQENLARATQLLNKTNQMNLSTRRLTEPEFLDWSHQADHWVWTVRVEDKYGDSGLTGLLGLAVVDGRARIVDFVLSCRVLGRKAEETMLHLAVEWARKLGLSEVEAVYLPTPKNKPCLDLFSKSGFVRGEGDRFVWKSEAPYPRVPFVKLEK